MPQIEKRIPVFVCERLNMKTNNKVLIILLWSRHSMGPLEDRCSGSPHKCGSGTALTILLSVHKNVTNIQQNSDL